jgi:hypothetical protein
MKKYLILLIISLLTFEMWAQSKITLNGFVTDAKTGEKLIGATIYIPQYKIGTQSNLYGFFSITIPASELLIVQVSYIGFETKEQTVLAAKSQKVDFALQESLQTLETIEIKANNPVKQTEMSVHTIPTTTIKQTPALAGEVDVLKVLQLLPGVKRGNEGSAGLYVRGGSPDQNLILLDGVPVYNVFHLFGFISVFNPDAVQYVKLIKGGIPARYGGRLSSVLDIYLKEGNLKKSSGGFSINPIAAKFTFETPIVKDKSSFIISARRTVLDYLFLAQQSSENKSGYNFYDANAKFNYIINPKNRIYLSFYTGRDKFFLKTINDNESIDYNFNWGNTTSVLRWNKIYNPQLFSNLAISYSNYAFVQQEKVNSGVGNDYQYKAQSKISDLAAQLDFDYEPSPKHSIKFGLRFSNQRFSPEVILIRDINIDTTFNEDRRVDALTGDLYFEDEVNLNEKTAFNAGLRASFFSTQSRSYPNLQPRLSLRYLYQNNLAFKASYTFTNQYLHLLTNSSLGAPTDLWVSSTERIRPQVAQQWALGAVKSLTKLGLEITVEAYYKLMQNVLEYKEGSSYLFNTGDTWEDKVAIGQGQAYGIEFLVQKNKGKWTGWVAYTLAWANRKMDGINQGRRFPFKYDRRHDISITANYKLNERRSISLVFVFASGDAITLPVGKYQGINPPYWGEGNNQGLGQKPYYENRNGFRTPTYHRLDFAYDTTKQRTRNKRTWTFSIYNAYSRLNAYFIYQSGQKFKKMTLFPIIPSIGYSLSF